MSEAPPSGEAPWIEFLALRPGQSARLSARSLDRAGADRLAELGFVPGTPVKIVRIAPLGDPIEVEIRGTRFCARRSELAALCVEPPEPGT